MKFLKIRKIFGKNEFSKFAFFIDFSKDFFRNIFGLEKYFFKIEKNSKFFLRKVNFKNENFEFSKNFRFFCEKKSYGKNRSTISPRKINIFHPGFLLWLRIDLQLDKIASTWSQYHPVQHRKKKYIPKVYSYNFFLMGTSYDIDVIVIKILIFRWI